jgi:Domain of unknown function (DUF4468) with TBP-like fold
VLAFLSGPLTLWAQVFPVDAGTGKIIYAEEVPVMDGPKTDLYNRARAWLQARGKSQEPLQVDDAANGLLVASNYVLLLVPEGKQHRRYKLWHTIKIEVENDRFWYSITGLELQKADTLALPAIRQARQPIERLVLPEAPAGKKVSGPPPALLSGKVRESMAALIRDLKKNML